MHRTKYGTNGIVAQYPIPNALQGSRRRASCWRGAPSVAYTPVTRESLITEAQGLQTPHAAKENMKPGMSNEGALSSASARLQLASSSGIESARFRHPSSVRPLPETSRV